jgi:hypothetical protein
MVDDVDITMTNGRGIRLRFLSYAQTLDGRIEYPGTLPISVENEERAGCVTVS